MCKAEAKLTLSSPELPRPPPPLPANAASPSWPPPAAAPAKLSLYDETSKTAEIREFRDALDNVIEGVNGGNELLTSNPLLAEEKLRFASNLASSLLTKMGQIYKPEKYSEPNNLQKTVMSLYVDVARGLSNALSSLGTLKEMTGSAREALLFYQSALPQAEKIGDVSTAFSCRVGVGTCYKEMGQIQKAIDLLMLELEQTKIEKDDVGRAIVCCNLSKCFLSLPFSSESFSENVGNAIEFAEQDVAISAKYSVEHPAQHGAAICQLAECLNRRGLYAKARQCYASAITLLEEGSDYTGRLMALISYSKMILTEGGGDDSMLPSSLAANELAHDLAVQALDLSKELCDKENEQMALGIQVHSKLANAETKARFYSCLGGDKSTSCAVCNTPLDYAQDDDIFTLLNCCKHSFHRECFLEWVAKDKLYCPVKGCKFGSNFVKLFKHDPSVVLRLAKGESNCLYYL